MKSKSKEEIKGKNCTNFSLHMNKTGGSSDSTPSYSFSKKSVSKSSGSINRPAGFEF
jgi:hypothetical protein